MPEGYKLGHVAKSKATRLRKADKIIKILKEHTDLKNARVLDIGTGAGYIAHALSKEARKVDSTDIIDDRKIKDGYAQKIVTDEKLPYEDETFDVVITNHVLEHVPDQEKHMSEICRVLKKDGIVYLASPNKWWLTDPHYKLPFISWMPRPVADKYLRVAKNRTWDIYSVSLGRLHRLAKQNGLEVTDKSWEILSNPKKYKINAPKGVSKVASKTPKTISQTLLFVMPTHLKILHKKK